MKVTVMTLPGLLRFEPRVYEDERGFFFEHWNETRHRDAGLSERFVQDNIVGSARGVLRGLHLQHPHAQGKLVSAVSGSVFDVAVDVRRGSPTFGQWEGIELSAENRVQLYVPHGFAHGYQVTSESAVVMYKVTDVYRPAEEVVITPTDPALGIPWPVPTPVLSQRDANGMLLADVADGQLPSFE